MAEKTQTEHDLANELADFRKKALANEPITDEELRDAIHKLKTFRDKTATPIKEKAVKKATAKITRQAAEDFFKDL